MKNITITNLEALNIASWSNQLTEEKRDALPMKVRFYLKKFISRILPDVKEFEDFRNAELKKIQDEYFGDEKSELREVENDENSVQDAQNPETKTVRVVMKNEYIEEYQDKIKILNDKLAEILSEKNTYECNTFDVDAFVEALPDDTPLEFDDINIIDAIFSEEG